jgi:hypothetical protein
MDETQQLMALLRPDNYCGDYTLRRRQRSKNAATDDADFRDLLKIRQPRESRQHSKTE